jgi:hypothetical protein
MIPYTLLSGIATAIPVIVSDLYNRSAVYTQKISWKEMASMATTAEFFRTSRLRDIGAIYGHAMPFGLGKKAYMGGICVFDSLIFVGAKGRSVPISRGSPPILE